MRTEMINTWVEKVRKTVNILEIIKKYVTLKQKGFRFWGKCPLCNDEISFSVVPEEGFFYCFKCNAGGNVFKFVSLMENISYFDAIRKLAKAYGMGDKPQ